MRRLVAAVLALACSGCLDFDKLLGDCADGGTCTPDGGGDAGGGSVGGGGGSVGGGGGGGGSATSGPGFCFQGFCWENPLPQGNALQAVWGHGAADVWAGGVANALMHWDGGSWTSWQGTFPIDSNADQVSALSGDADHVVAGLYQQAPFLLGTGGWAPLGSFLTSDGVAVSGNRVWSVNSSQLGFWEGGPWLLSDQPNGELVVADAPRAGAWVVSSGSAGRELRFCPPSTSEACADGGTLFQSTLEPLVGLALVDDGGLVATGISGTLYFVQPADGGLTSSSTGAGFSPNGSSFLPDGGGLVVGPAHGIRAWQNGDWANVPLRDEPQDGTAFLAVWASADFEGSWAVGESGTLARISDGGLTWVNSGTRADVVALVDHGGEPIAFTVSPELLARDGGSWSPRAPVSALDVTPFTLAPEPDGGVLVGTVGGLVGVWTGAFATHAVMVSDGGDITAAVALGDGLAFVGTATGGIYLRSLDGGWSLDYQADAGVLGLDGYDAQHVWAVGEHTIFLARGGPGSWTPLPLSGNFDPAVSLRSVWAEGPDGGAWAVGQGGTVAYLAPGAGQAAAFTTLQGRDLLVVRGRSATDVYAAGQAGEVVRLTPGTSTELPTGCSTDLTTLLIGPGQTLWLGGQTGTILRYQP